MQTRLLIALFLGLGFVIASAAVGQKTRTDLTDEERLRAVEDFLERRLEATQPDVKSENWFLLSEGVGMEVVRQDDEFLVGTLYIRKNRGSWRKVAIASPGPDVVPLSLRHSRATGPLTIASIRRRAGDGLQMHCGCRSLEDVRQAKDVYRTEGHHARSELETGIASLLRACLLRHAGSRKQDSG